MAGACGSGLGRLWRRRNSRQGHADVREHGPAGSAAQLVELVAEIQPEGVVRAGANGVLQGTNRLVHRVQELPAGLDRVVSAADRIAELGKIPCK
eukprot:1915205-Alexandrium_andersonii.AAC.1